MSWFRELAPQGVRYISTQVGRCHSRYFSTFSSTVTLNFLCHSFKEYLVIELFIAVRTRMKSVKNIQKITKAMKMVAASKLQAIQPRAENSRGLWSPFIALLGDTPGT